jgi:hypothetical protein
VDLRIGRDTRTDQRTHTVPRRVRRNNRLTVAVLASMAASWVCVLIVMASFVGALACAGGGGFTMPEDPSDGTTPTTPSDPGDSTGDQDDGGDDTADGPTGPEGLSVDVAFGDAATEARQATEVGSVVLTLRNLETLEAYASGTATPQERRVHLGGAPAGLPLLLEAHGHETDDGSGPVQYVGVQRVTLQEDVWTPLTISLTSTASNVAVEPSDTEIHVGVVVGLTPTALDDDEAMVLTDGEWTWTSSDPSVATVDGEGNVTALAEGEVTISATDKTSSAQGSGKVKVAALAVTPAALDFGTNLSERTFVVDNTGVGKLEWSASTAEGWITLSPSSGVNRTEVTVTINRSVLAEGVHTGTIQIESNVGNRTVSVRAEVPAPGTNSPPTVDSVTAGTTLVAHGATVDLTCAASDPDGDTLVYRWSAEAGAFDSSGSTAVWTAPEQNGEFILTCTADDGEGGTDSGSVTVEVTDKGGLDVSIQ